MRKTSTRILALIMSVLMIMSTAAVSFGASVGKVKSLKLSASAKTQLNIKWKAVSKASGYQIALYNAKTKKWVDEAKTTSNTYKDKGLTPGKAYTYKVRAYITKNGKTTYGAYSEKLVALTKPAQPVKPAVSKVTPTSAKLSWTAAKGATGYVIYRYDSSSEKYVKMGTTTKLTYTPTFPSSPGKVYFKIASYAKDSGKTVYSAKSPACTAEMKPKKVETFSATNVTGSSVTLKWTAPAGASKYILSKIDPTTGGEYQKFAETKATSYEVKFPAAPGTVYFKVRAVSNYSGKQINAGVSPTVKVTMKPEKVNDVDTKSGVGTITLNWKAASGASEYEIYKLNPQNNKYEKLDVTKKNSYVVKGLENATTYSFKIRAVAKYSASVLYADYSPEVQAKTTFGEITGFTFTISTANNLVLSWNPVKDADGYLVEKRTDSDWILIKNTTSNTYDASAYEPDGKLAKGKEYIYRVKAYVNMESEMLYSEYSNEAVVHSIPAVPKGFVTGTGTEHSIVIEWEKVKGADAYEIWVLNNETGTWISHDVTEGKTYTYGKKEYVYYTDKGIEESGTYKYKIQSVVYNNGEKCVSDESEIISHDYIYYKDADQSFVGDLDQSGILGYLYDPNQGCFYTSGDPWQRNFGFNQVYDVTSQWVMIQYDTVRFKFNYQGTDWMIQPWKGQYGWVLYGGEIGVYKKYTERDAEHYDCAKDEDMLRMSMSLYKYNPENGEWEHIFDRPYALYWWCTGFVPGFIRFGVPGQTTYSDILLEFRITMKDFEMLRAFTGSLKEQGFDYTIDGLDVNFKYR